jgi:PD-(D/E)XK endonuclease
VLIAADLIRRGYRIAIPYGEDWDFDLILCHSLTNGKVKATKRYTAATIDWLAVYDPTTDRCYYVPATELGAGMCEMSLRLQPTRNNQRRFVRFASDYLEI